MDHEKIYKQYSAADPEKLLQAVNNLGDIGIAIRDELHSAMNACEADVAAKRAQADRRIAELETLIESNRNLINEEKRRLAAAIANREEQEIILREIQRIKNEDQQAADEIETLKGLQFLADTALHDAAEQKFEELAEITSTYMEFKRKVYELANARGEKYRCIAKETQYYELGLPLKGE